MSVQAQSLRHRVLQHLSFIYEEIALEQSLEAVTDSLIEAMRLTPACNAQLGEHDLWSEADVVLITYGDSIMCESLHTGDAEARATADKPLHTLKSFLDKYVKSHINSVHILPFFPYSSDDGFAVMDYASINPALGGWEDVSNIAKDYHLMSDLVVNHCSSRCIWFDNFLKESGPGHDFFRVVSPGEDLTHVVRPRTSPLIREVERPSGPAGVWCTFSHDQVDFDFRNPAVLLEFVRIIRFYLDQGVRIFRFDAVGFVWKTSGTSCINLDETHEIVRLFRTLIEQADPNAVIITETNVPNLENLAYFGNANEAHCVYNFSLPPLLLNTMVTGSCKALKQWMMSMPPAQLGTTYFNFIASHDGIGLRPAEGLLSDEEIRHLINAMISFGGRVSLRTLPNGETRPYEINIALFDAMGGTLEGPDKWGLDRFVCAHAIMIAMEGIPGIYIHSLVGTRNDYEKVEHTAHPRSINRHRWNYTLLCELLDDERTDHGKVYNRIAALLDIRVHQPAFHPNATQFTLHLGDQIFGFWRQDQRREQSIFCIFNVSTEPQVLTLADINLYSTDDWFDLISGDEILDQSATITLAPYQSLWITNFDAKANL